MALSFDLINAAFEMTGATMRTLDCLHLYRAKRFLGGSLFTSLFFFLWGVFNMFFYPSLHQTWSLIAAIVLTVVNGIWLVMAIYYNHRVRIHDT